MSQTKTLQDKARKVRKQQLDEALDILRGAHNCNNIPIFDYVARYTFAELQEECVLEGLDRGTVIGIDRDEQIVSVGYWQRDVPTFLTDTGIMTVPS